MLPTVSRQVRERYKIDEQEKKKIFPRNLQQSRLCSKKVE